MRSPERLDGFPAGQKICAVIVSYFPDAGFSERIRRIQLQVGQVIVVDNTPESSDSVAQVSSDHGVKLISNRSNLGIATALNQGIRWAREAGYSWVLLLDQDTVPFTDLVDTLIAAYSEFPGKERLAIIGCSPFLDEWDRAPREGVASWIFAKSVITSGTLLSLQAAANIGPFREEFFIDGVDFEFCLRARRKGYAIIEVLKPVMHHVIGSPLRMPRRLKWLARATSNHTPWRSYYITRNLVVLTREYLRSEPAWVLAKVYTRIKSMILMILFEHSRLQKIKYIILGFRDGLRGRFDRSVP